MKIESKSSIPTCATSITNDFFFRWIHNSESPAELAWWLLRNIDFWPSLQQATVVLAKLTIMQIIGQCTVKSPFCFDVSGISQAQKYLKRKWKTVQCVQNSSNCLTDNVLGAIIDLQIRHWKNYTQTFRYTHYYIRNVLTRLLLEQMRLRWGRSHMDIDVTCK